MTEIELNSIYTYFQHLTMEEQVAWIGISLGFILVIIGLLIL